MRTTFGSATSPGEIATHFGAGRSAMPAVPVGFDACPMTGVDFAVVEAHWMVRTADPTCTAGLAGSTRDVD